MATPPGGGAALGSQADSSIRWSDLIAAYSGAADTLQIEDRVGTKELTIPTRTDGQPAQSDNLTLTAIIPQVVTVDPKIVKWTDRTGPGLQTARIHVAEPYRITTATATPGHPAVTAATPRVLNGRDIEVDLTWTDRSYRQPVKVTITTDVPIKRQASVVLWAVNHTRP